MAERFTSEVRVTNYRKVHLSKVVVLATVLTSIWTLSSARSEQPAHNRSVLGSNPRASTTFFWKTNTFAKIAGRNWIYFFSSTGSTPKAWEASDAALPQNWQVTGRSWVRIPERPLLFLVLQAVQYFAQQHYIIFVYCFSSILYIVLCAAVVLLYIKNNNSFLITYSPGNPSKFKVFDII